MQRVSQPGTVQKILELLPGFAARFKRLDDGGLDGVAGLFYYPDS